MPLGAICEEGAQGELVSTGWSSRDWNAVDLRLALPPENPLSGEDEREPESVWGSESKVILEKEPRCSVGSTIPMSLNEEDGCDCCCRDGG